MQQKLAEYVDKDILASDASDGPEGSKEAGDDDMSEEISDDSNDEAKTQEDGDKTPRSPDSTTKSASKTKSRTELQIEDEKPSPKKHKRKGDYHSVSTSYSRVFVHRLWDPPMQSFQQLMTEFLIFISRSCLVNRKSLN